MKRPLVRLSFAAAAIAVFAMAKRRTTSRGNSPPRGPATMVDAPSPRLQAARQLWEAGHRDDAMVRLTEAIREEPNNVRTYITAARAAAERYDFERMEEILERLVRRAPRHPGVHHYIGETYGLLKLPDRATASYRRAAHLTDSGPPTWMELASLYERAHRLDEAEELIERTAQTGFDLPLVALVRGRIQRRQKRMDLAEATFRALIARLPEDSEWACQAWGELALMKDDQGDFAGAIDAIERCKRAQQLRAGAQLATSKRIEATASDLIAAITRDDFRQWREAAQSLPAARTALLTGFPRSGTTLVEQALDAHPDLVSSEERDFVGQELLHTLAFGRPGAPLAASLRGLGVDELAQLRQRYFQAMEYLLGEPIAGRMHLDKNPSYNLMIPLVLRILPETRLIIALRDPRDVVLSCYLRYLPLNAVSVRYLDVKQTAQRYALDMGAWLQLRELIETPWREVRYEDTVADLETQIRQALDALGLAWDEQVLNYRQRLMGSKHVSSPTYEAVAQPIYAKAVGRWKNYERLLAPAFETLAPFVREFGYEA